MTGHILPESTNACPTSPTTDQPELLKVIQADRAFAAQWIVIAPQNARLIRSGEWDHHHGVQAAARHRLTSTTPTLGDMVMVPREALQRARDLAMRQTAEARIPECGDFGAIAQDLDAMIAAAPASPIPTATGGMGKARLALEAIKAVTATTKDVVAGLSRIMAITCSAGVDAPYSNLMAKPDVALIVNRPRGEWRHLFERADACTIPPEGWTCSRTPGHDGPCAASPIPTSANEGEREAITLYREIDALGGARNEDGEYNAGWSDGHSRALDDALEIVTKRGFTEAADAGLAHEERVAYEERILALEMDVERLAKGERPIYADAAKLEARAREVLRANAHSRGPQVAAMHDENALVNVGTAISAMITIAALSPALDNTAVEGEDRFANDGAAKALYDTWADMPGWVPWVERGNSDMQERARREVTL